MMQSKVVIVMHFYSCTVVAPLFPLKPKAYQIMEGATPDLVVANFSQPYSISMLRYIIVMIVEMYRIAENHGNLWNKFSPVR